jgi:tetratricopeptide (TPR) repeat protein
MYMQMVVRGDPTFPVTPSLIAKNLGFFIRNLPFAAKKAEAHLNQAIALNREMGANYLLGQACLDLGILHKAKKRRSKARECFSEAIALFEHCEADAFLQQAKEGLASLK